MTLSILVNNREIKKYFHYPEDRYSGLAVSVPEIYVEGRQDQAYIIRYRNNTNKRQKLVVSVDGLNVKTGDVNWDDAYVCNPRDTIDIPGWRKDQNNTAAFRFSSVKNSYNNQNEHGDTNNVGVIGCKVWDEKEKPKPVEYHYHHHNWPYPSNPYYWGPYYVHHNVTPPWNISYLPLNSFSLSGVSVSDNTKFTSGGTTMSASGSNPPQASFTMDSFDSPMPQNFVAQAAADPAPVNNSIGTGWGENVEFKTVPVYADWEAQPTAIHVIYYDEKRGLERRGVDLREKASYVKPNPFPDGCPPPKHR